MTRYEQVIQKAIELIDATPAGKRYSELVREISQALPDIPINTVHGSLVKFRAELPSEIYLPTRGLYKATRFREAGEVVVEVTQKIKAEKIKEEDFYEPFGDWLVNELEECTRAISLGGNRFKDKWGTPDVVGVRDTAYASFFVVERTRRR
jgi:hypothetical protein